MVEAANRGRNDGSVLDMRSKREREIFTNGDEGGHTAVLVEWSWRHY